MVAGLLAAAALLPYLASAVVLAVLHRDLVTFGDDSVIEQAVRDVFTTRSPLVGQVSRLTLNSPGPLAFYLLAPTYWAFGGVSSGLFAATAVLNACWMAAILCVTWQIGRLRLLALVVPVLLVGVHAVGPGLVNDPWNPLVVVLPLVLFVLLCWTFAEGTNWAIPWLVAVGSFAVQTHASPVLPMGAVALVAIGWRYQAHRRSAPGRGSLRAALVVGGLVGLVAWLPPILDIVRDPPGNLPKLVWFFLASDDRQVTGSDVIASIRFPLGFPPSFLTGEPRSLGPPDYLADISAPPAVPLGLLVLVVAAWFGRRDRRVLVPVSLAAALVLAAVVAVWRLVGPLVDYVLIWTVFVSAFMWIATLWALASLYPARAWLKCTALSTGVLVSMVASVMLTQDAVRPPTNGLVGLDWDTVVGDVAADLDQSRPVVVDLRKRDESTVTMLQSLVPGLSRRGFDVFVSGQEKWFETRFRAELDPSDQSVVITDEEAPEQGKLMAQREGAEVWLVDPSLPTAR